MSAISRRFKEWGDDITGDILRNPSGACGTGVRSSNFSFGICRSIGMFDAFVDAQSAGCESGQN